MSSDTTSAVTVTTSQEQEDDWLTGATACSIENGDECEACQ